MHIRRGNSLLPFCLLFARNLFITNASNGGGGSSSATAIFTGLASYSSNSSVPVKMSEAAQDSETYVPGSSSVAFVTTPDENTAKNLARNLVEKKLAACVNIIPQIQSIYMWEGKVNEDNEYLMMIKTRTSRVDELSKFVREHHPYSVAEVIALPIENGNAPYLRWIGQTVPEK